MILKKFLIWLVKSIIILLLVTFIFSAVTLDFPKLISGIFSDVYGYSSPEAQKEAIGSLAQTCYELNKGDELTFQDICTNQSARQQIEDNCIQYRQSKRQGMQFENEQELEETCYQLESGQIDEDCKKMSDAGAFADKSKLGSLCRSYSNQEIDDKQFFAGFIGMYIGSQGEPKIGFLDKYHKIMNFLNSNKIIYFMVILILFAALYFITGNTQEFLLIVAGISLSLGIVIMLPYFGIIMYEKLIGFDTTPVMSSIFGISSSLDPKSILSVVLLLLLRTYNEFIITLGIILLTAGIAGKIYGIALRKRNEEQAAAPKPKKKNKS